MSPGKGQQHGREAARRRAAQAAVREANRRRQRRLRLTIGVIVVVVVLLAVVISALAGGDDDDAAVDTTTTTSADEETTTTAGDGEPIEAEPIEDDPEATTTGAFEFGTGACAPARKPETRPETFDAPFQRCLTEGAEYKAVIGTNEGTFTIDLLPARAPGTVNNFIQLAKWGWFDGITFHRVVPGFVIQAGDPTGTGSGGPGFTIADELPSAVTAYTPGAVAMANIGQPDSGGSQWFVCVDCSTLPGPGYSLFGWVSDGFDVVQAINATQSGEVTIVAVEILEDPLAEE